MKYLCFIFCVLLVGACSSTKGSGKDTLFCELDKEIQDTLQSVSQKVLEEDYAPQAMIDFSGNCKFTERYPRRLVCYEREGRGKRPAP